MLEVSALRLAHAAHALELILKFTFPADSVLKHYFRNYHELGVKDRAFIAEASFSVLRRLLWLRYLAPEANARELLLISLVKLQGLSIRELQSVVSKDEMKLLQKTKAAADPSELTLAIKTNFPEWLLERLAPAYSEERIIGLARAMQRQAPLDLRVNTLLSSRDQVLQALVDEGLEARPTPYSPAGIRLDKQFTLQRHALFTGGKIEVQDEGSQLLAYLVNPKRRELVVDFCAGAGGKTLALGALMHTQGRLYAFDISPKRLNNLKLRVNRAQLTHVHPQLISHEGDQKIKRLHKKVDKVLVDAPCTGLGTLRRNPDLSFRQDPGDLAELVSKQHAILDSAAKLVKPNGFIVYATCSILKEENEQVVEGFLARHPQFQLQTPHEVLLQHGVRLDTGRYLQVYPDLHQTDGFFGAVMKRCA